MTILESLGKIVFYVKRNLERMTIFIGKIVKKNGHPSFSLYRKNHGAAVRGVRRGG